MKVQLIKMGNEQWDAKVDGAVIGKVKKSYKYHGSYEATLNNGTVINAFNQTSLKNMIAKNL